MASFNILNAAGRPLVVNTDDATLDELLLIDSLDSSKLNEEQRAVIHATVERRKSLSESERKNADAKARKRYAAIRRLHKWRVPQLNGIRYLLVP